MNHYREVTNRRAAMSTWFFDLGLSLFPIAFFGVLLWLKTTRPWFYEQHVAMSDGAIACGTSVVYVVACVMAAILAARLHKQDQRPMSLLYIALAVFLFWRGGEAINWGQLLVDKQTAAIAIAGNAEPSISIHRFLCQLSVNSVFIAVAFYGAFSRLLVSAYTGFHNRQARDLLTPGPALICYFLPALALYTYYDYLSEPLARWFGSGFSYSAATDARQHFMLEGDQEPIQFLLGIGLLLFVVINSYRHGSRFHR